jgi:hypothetical protein
MTDEERHYRSMASLWALSVRHVKDRDTRELIIDQLADWLEWLYPDLFNEHLFRSSCRDTHRLEVAS